MGKLIEKRVPWSVKALPNESLADMKMLMSSEMKDLVAPAVRFTTIG